MKNPNVKPVSCQSCVMLLASVLFACSLAVSASFAGDNGTVGNPCLAVTKTCDTVTIGQPNLVTAVVTNCGDVFISNIVVVDNLYGSIGTIASLPPGGSATLTKSVTNTCGNFPNTVTATGMADIPSIIGTPVQATSTAVCVVVENPCITVTKTCNSVPLGQPNLLTAVVTNCGNVPINNITISDNLYGPIGTVALLSPGGTATLTKSVTNACGNFPNIVTAAGASPCGTPVQATSSGECVVFSAVGDVTQPGDPLVPTSSNSPGSEGVANAIDNQTTKYLNFDRLNTGFTVTPSAGASILVGLSLTSANDAPERDPASYVLTGSTDGTNFVPISSGAVPPFTARFQKQTIFFSGNSSSFTSYRLIFPTVVGPGGNSMQIAEVELLAALPENPCITVTKTCNSVPLGQNNLVSVVVTNCGNVPLVNIAISDNLYGSIGTIASLAPDGSAMLTKSVANSCGDFPNTVTAAGTSLCGTPVQAASTAVCSVMCGPKLCVTKEVVCDLPTGCADNWSSFASAAKTADNAQCPSFCYRVRVTNCGSEDLNNVTVVDNVLALAACNWPTTMARLQTVECILAGVEHCDGVTNTVTATGVGVSSGSNVTASATAAVEVRPINITCNLTVNGQSSTTIRCDGQAHLVTNAVEICNTGELPLANITIQAPDLAALGGDCTNVANLRLSLLPGECTNVLVCTDIVACQTNGACAYSNNLNVTVTGAVDTNTSSACSWTRNVSNQVVAVTASSTCSATVVVVVDTTPPRVACVPGVNPSGKKIPVAGKNPASGQNPDGYYQLLGRDDCDPNPAIYIADTGSDFIAGPFASGDVIKLTQSPGKQPSQDSAPAPIVAHIHLRGDGLLFAVDANGNASEPELCLVPRPPK